jgi:hypothetical protein
LLLSGRDERPSQRKQKAEAACADSASNEDERSRTLIVRAGSWRIQNGRASQLFLLLLAGLHANCQELATFDE